MAAANYIDKNHQKFFPEIPQSVDFSTLMQAGVLPQGLPSTNTYGQAPCLLVKKLKKSKNSGIPNADSKIDASYANDSYADDGAIFAVLVTEGGEDIPIGNLSYIASLSGDGGGYIPPVAKKDDSETTPIVAPTPITSKSSRSFYREPATIAESSMLTSGLPPSLTPTTTPVDIEAKGVYGTWKNSLNDFVNNQVTCSGKVTSANHLASLVPWKGSRGISDFLYRKWIPGNANADANKMMIDLSMSMHPNLKIENNIDHVKVADANYLTLLKSDAKKDHICNCKDTSVTALSIFKSDCPNTYANNGPKTDPVFSEGTLALDSENNKGIMTCHNGQWAYPTNLIPKLKKGPSCESYSDSETTGVISAGALVGTNLPILVPVNGGDVYPAICKRYCPASTRLAAFTAECREANKLTGFFGGDIPLKNFSKLQFVTDNGNRQGVEIECMAKQDDNDKNNIFTRAKKLNLQLYCRDYDDDIVKAQSFSSEIEEVKTDEPSVNEENGGCWVKSLKSEIKLKRISMVASYGCAPVETLWALYRWWAGK